MKSIHNLYQYTIVVAFIGLGLNSFAYTAGIKVMMEAGLFIKVILASLTIYFTLRLRDENGGYFSFQEAFRTIFIIGICYGVGEAIFTFVLYNFIDPDLFAKIQERLIWQLEEVLQNSNSETQVAYFNQIINLLKKTRFQYEIWLLGIDVLSKILKYAFYALFLGRILKKDNPNPLA